MTSGNRNRWIVVAVIVAVLAIIGALTDDGDGDTVRAGPASTVVSGWTTLVQATATSVPTTAAATESTLPETTPAPTAASSSPPEPPTTVAPPTSVGRPGSGVTAWTRMLLANVPVKGRAPKTGYDRAAFGPAWTDNVDVAGGHNGCDTRNDVLRRDLTGLTTRPGTGGCIILTGVLVDPYTGTRIEFRRGEGTSQAVQIDHVVALSDAWQKGAQSIGETRRRALANDPLNLLAVDGPTNQRKSDADAATWLPPNKAFRCRYVALQTRVKARYDLWMTQAEHDAIARVLSGCDDAAIGEIP